VSFEEGEAVFPQNRVLKVIDLTRRYISVSLDEKAAVLVKKNQKVRIAFEGLPGQTFSGLVASVYPSEGQFFVKVNSKELPPEILPGMSADLAIEAGVKEGVFVAPIRAVQERKVTVQRNGKRLRIPVQLGLTQGEDVEIVSADLAEGDILRYQ
jgi:multidrug efflux pump subunit AcrA (membrane-fusion protein)